MFSFKTDEVVSMDATNSEGVEDYGIRMTVEGLMTEIEWNQLDHVITHGNVSVVKTYFGTQHLDQFNKNACTRQELVDVVGGDTIITTVDTTTILGRITPGRYVLKKDEENKIAKQLDQRARSNFNIFSATRTDETVTKNFSNGTGASATTHVLHVFIPPQRLK